MSTSTVLQYGFTRRNQFTSLATGAADTVLPTVWRTGISARRTSRAHMSTKPQARK
jgi:hypothetical protein